MGLHRLAAEAVALSVEHGGDQGSNSGIDVDDGAAGKVERRDMRRPAHHLGYYPEPATRAPDPVRDRIVNESRPEKHKDNEGTELCPLGESARDEGRRYHSEHELEDHVGLVGNRRRVELVRLGRQDVLEADPGEVTDETAVVRAEGERVAD